MAPRALPLPSMPIHLWSVNNDCDSTCSCHDNTDTTHFMKCLWAHNSNLIKYVWLLHEKWRWNHVTILHMLWQISCHDICKIVTWSDHYCLCKSYLIFFSRFEFWAHNPFVKWVPSFIILIKTINTTNILESLHTYLLPHSLVLSTATLYTLTK